MSERKPSLRERAVIVSPPRVPILPPLMSNGMMQLPPPMARWTPPLTKTARALRDYGMIREVGRITSFSDGQGSGTTTIQIDFPGMATGGSGAQSISFPLDLEAARYLPPRTRIRMTLEILGEEEEE